MFNKYFLFNKLKEEKLITISMIPGEYRSSPEEQHYYSGFYENRMGSISPNTFLDCNISRIQSVPYSFNLEVFFKDSTNNYIHIPNCNYLKVTMLNNSRTAICHKYSHDDLKGYINNDLSASYWLNFFDYVGQTIQVQLEIVE